MLANTFHDAVLKTLPPTAVQHKLALRSKAIENLQYRLGKLVAYLDECAQAQTTPRRGRIAFEAGKLLCHLVELAESQNLPLGTVMYWMLHPKQPGDPAGATSGAVAPPVAPPVG